MVSCVPPLETVGRTRWNPGILPSAARWRSTRKDTFIPEAHPRERMYSQGKALVERRHNLLQRSLLSFYETLLRWIRQSDVVGRPLSKSFAFLPRIFPLCRGKIEERVFSSGFPRHRKCINKIDRRFRFKLQRMNKYAYFERKICTLKAYLDNLDNSWDNISRLRSGHVVVKSSNLEWLKNN